MKHLMKLDFCYWKNEDEIELHSYGWLIGGKLSKIYVSWPIVPTFYEETSAMALSNNRS